MKTISINRDVKNYAIDKLNEIEAGSVCGCNLHNEIFNTHYFIIGYYEAEQFLKETEEGIFGAIALIKEYEEDNFGEVYTDFFSSEKVANMYAYIKGEELLQCSETLRDRRDDYLTAEDIAKIIEEIEIL